MKRILEILAVLILIPALILQRAMTMACKINKKLDDKEK